MIRSTEKSNGLSGNRTRDLPGQPTALLCAPNIEIGSKETGLENMDWIHMAEDGDQ
jgi:hypothetical protein